jgi:hypothetical protein
MRTYRFLVTYTNDKRQTEVKAISEDRAVEILKGVAKRALMQITDIKLIETLNN